MNSGRRVTLSTMDGVKTHQAPNTKKTEARQTCKCREVIMFRHYPGMRVRDM